MSLALDHDTDAVALIKEGKASGLEALYDRHAVAIYSLALRIVRDVGEAEDVTQEVFAQVWTTAARYDPSRGTVAAWVLMMARSRALDRLRRRRSAFKSGTSDSGLTEIPDPSPSVELIAATDEQVRAAQAALSTLPLKERAALELAYYEGLTQMEIAERTATPLGTVKTRIRNALRRVREAMTVGETSTSPES